MSRSGGKRVPAFGESILFPPLRPASARPGHGRQAAPIFPPPRVGHGMPVGVPLCLTRIPIFPSVSRASALSGSMMIPHLTRIPSSPKCFKVFWKSLLRHKFRFSQNTFFCQGFTRCFAILGWAAGALADPGFGWIWGTRFFSPLRPVQAMAERRHPFFPLKK